MTDLAGVKVKVEATALDYSTPYFAAHSDDAEISERVQQNIWL
jgi:hypothetical protein